MFNTDAANRIEIFVDRLIGGTFEIEIDGDKTVVRTKADANLIVDQAVRVAQDIDALWSVYGMDKLK